MQKILYVEDDLSLIDGLQYTLESSGYAVDNARTVKERDGQYGQKWAGSNGGGRRAGAAVTSSAKLTSHPGAAREPSLTA